MGNASIDQPDQNGCLGPSKKPIAFRAGMNQSDRADKRN